MSKIQLYVVQPNETTSDIARKFNTNEDEIKRLNPTLRYSRPHAGQPLNIAIEERDSNANPSVYDSCVLVFHEYLSLQKQTIFAHIYLPEYESALLNTLNKLTDQVVDCLNKHIKITNDYNMKLILQEFESELVNFADVIRTKDPNAIKQYNKHMDDLINNFIQLSIINTDKPKETILHDITKKWQMYILKLLAKKYDEAEKIYNEIQTIYVNLAELIVSQ